MIKDDTKSIFCRYSAHFSDDALAKNLRIDPTTVTIVIKFRQETFGDDGTVSTAPSTIPGNENYQD